MEESKKNEIVRILSKDPEHRYYVYRLVDPRNKKTIYVGKGCGDRMLQHVDWSAIEFEEHADTSGI